MASLALHREEGLGLGVAVVLHLLLVAALLLQPSTRELVEAPERVTVNLTEDVGMTAEAPEIVTESSAAIAPELADLPSPPPEQVQAPAPRPQPRATRAPRPRQTTAPEPRPTRTATPPRGSRLGDNFLPGQGASTTTQDTRVPASQIGRSARASIVQAIARQVRPHWQGKAPSGAEAEQLVTILAFELNEDGSLKGRPRVVRQLGVTPANQAQKGRHAEVAIRAVQLAAPFDLPLEYYNAWKSIRGAQFDRNLSR